MELDLPTSVLRTYKSLSQRARVATEAWGAANLYCANCTSPELTLSPPGTPVTDFVCPNCAADFQLKSQSRVFSSRIVDSAYSVMKRAIDQRKTPNLFVLHYEPEGWTVQDVLLIPNYAFSHSAIECRKPLGPHARRAGWIGCNILLCNIPDDAKIPLITGGIAKRPTEVRERYAKLRSLNRSSPDDRGWTLDALNVVRGLGKEEFALADMYNRESQLGRLHPRNRHVRDKIRQQLQILRNLGILDFTSPGHYRLR